MVSNKGNKIQLAVMLTPTAREMLGRLSEHKGLSLSGIVETAVRELFRAEGLELDK